MKKIILYIIIAAQLVIFNCSNKKNNQPRNNINLKSLDNKPSTNWIKNKNKDKKTKTRKFFWDKKRQTEELY